MTKMERKKEGKEGRKEGRRRNIQLTPPPPPHTHTHTHALTHSHTHTKQSRKELIFTAEKTNLSLAKLAQKCLLFRKQHFIKSTHTAL